MQKKKRKSPCDKSVGINRDWYLKPVSYIQYTVFQILRHG